MKYLEHFGLTRNPFARLTPSEAFYFSTTFKEGLKRLECFGANGEGIATVVGAPGCGKTALVEYFAVQLKEREQARVCCWNFSSTGPYGFLAAMTRHLGGRPARSKSEVALRLVEQLAANRLPTVLALDEAHLLPDDSLQDLRLLVELPGHTNLLLLLMGQLPLGDTLAEEGHLSLRQRLTMSHHMSPLSRPETNEYLDQRLRPAGGSVKLFDAMAIDLIFEHSQGAPRMVNRLALQSLLAAAARGKKYVDEESVQTAHNDIERM